MRSRMTIVAAVVVGLTAGLLLPGPAVADTGPVLSSVAALPGDPGLLLVSASSTAPLTSFALTVVGPSEVTAKTTTTVTALHLVSGTKTGGVWQTDARLVLPFYGTYAVTTTATDADGHTSAPFTSALAYARQTVTQDVRSGPADLDQFHPTFTVSGRVLVFDPMTARTVARADAAIFVDVGNESTGGFTRADGTYSIPFSPYETSNLHSVPYTVSVDGEVIDQGSFTEHVATTRVVATTSAARLRLGSSVTFSGTVQYLDSGTWKPTARRGLTLFDGATELQKTTTGADGRFAFTTSPPRSAVLQVRIDDGPWWTGAAASFPTTVQIPTGITWSEPRIDEQSRLQVSGGVSGVNTTDTPTGGRLYVQRSTDGRTGWTSIGYVNLRSSGGFDAKGYLKQPSGYFRLYGVPDGDFLPSYSRVVHLSRTRTRIAKLSVPRRAHRRQAIVLTGSVQSERPSGAVGSSGSLAAHHGGRGFGTDFARAASSSQAGGKWQPIAGTHVYVFFQKKAGKPFRQVGAAVTDRAGRFSAKAVAKKTGYWTVVWFTDSERYLNAYGPLIRVRIR